MEGNRDESERCINLAEKYIKSGQTDNALKFLNKAERLYPSKRAKDLLNRLATSDRTTCDNKTEESKDSQSSPASRRGSHSECQEIQPKYTQEQVEAVRKIRRCKDFYEILGLSKECDDDDIKKAYKKLALKFHPDKNHAPGATEAFKAIGNAFAILSDTQKRRRYDEFGTADAEPRRTRHYNGYDYDFSRGFESDVSAEDLFRMFFGGAVFTPDHHHHHHGPRQHRAQQRNENPYTFLLQLSPLILIIVMSLLSTVFVGQPLYSLHRDAKYMRERKTRNLGVNYYVREDFVVPQSSGDLRKLERQVEEEYVMELRQNCYRERNNREAAMWRAQMYGNSQLYQQAINMRLKSCEQLQTVSS